MNFVDCTITCDFVDYNKIIQLVRPIVLFILTRQYLFNIIVYLFNIIIYLFDIILYLFYIIVLSSTLFATKVHVTIFENSPICW